MMRKAAAVGAALALALGSAAAAQAPDQTISPERLALAHKLLELSGGRAQIESSMKTIYSAIFANVGRQLPPEQQKFAVLIQKDLETGELALIPDFIDASARVYANNLSVRELNDYIAFQESDSGRAIRAKAPVIFKEVMFAITPIVQSAMPSIMQKVVVDVCAQAQCTDKDRQVIASSMSNALQAHRS